MANVVLVQMPFQSVSRPSIALSLLRGVLEANGHTAEIRYLNVEYARRIGLNLYRMASEQMPAETLYGEMVFSAMWPGHGDEIEPAMRLVIERHLLAKNVPEWLINILPDLAAEARDLVRDESLGIAKGDFDLVGFNTTFNLAPSLAMAERLKMLGGRSKIVLGGASCEDVMGESVLRLFPAVDYVCPGEGETALLNLAQHLDDAGSPETQIPGMLSSAQPKARKPARWQDLDALPTPRYEDWFRQIEQARLPLSGGDIEIPIETSRGCWYGAQQHCTFCGLNGDSLFFRSKSPERVIHDIESALQYGVNNVNAVDNILDFHYFRTLLPALAERKLPAKIFYEIKSKVTREQVELMHSAGIRCVQPGIESLSTPILKLMRKGVDAYHNIRLLKWCEELGIRPMWNLLYGFPREDMQDYLEMFKILPMLHHLRPPFACRVRLDRFSPLDFNGRALGVARRWPPEPYQYIYGHPMDDLNDLVYYFDFVPDGGKDPEEYGRVLRELVDDWQASYESSALLRVEKPDGCWVFDTRPVATIARDRIDGCTLEILQRADRGVRLADLTSGLSEHEALPVIDRLVSLGWLLPIDGRMLSLVTDYTPVIPASVPEELLEAFCLECSAVRHRPSLALGQTIDGARTEAESLAARFGYDLVSSGYCAGSAPMTARHSTKK